MITMQETVNGVTFEDESWVHPQPATYADAEKYARAILGRTSLVTYVRIMTQVSESMSIRVATVWR